MLQQQVANLAVWPPAAPAPQVQPPPPPQYQPQHDPLDDYTATQALRQSLSDQSATIGNKEQTYSA